MTTPNATIDDLIGEIAGDLLRSSAALAEEVSATLSVRVPRLALEPSLATEFAASTRANVGRFLSAVAARPGEPVPPDVPPEALDLARTFVRRGIDLEVLAHVYRWGQNIAWRRWMDVAVATVPPAMLAELLARSSALLFGYVDAVLERISAQVEHERAELLTGAGARREQTVRLLLDGAPVSEDSASRLLGYPLERGHVALVIWSDPAVELEHGALERVATAMAREANTGRALTIAAGRSSLWVWFAVESDLSVELVASALASCAPGPRAALGGRHHGAAGFRRSHDEALAAQRLLVGGGGARRVIAHRQVEVIALMAQDLPRLTEFVVETLGPLVPRDRAASELVETIRIYLQEGDNAARAAARLGTHRNTVLQRIARAERGLGYRLSDRRLPLTVAVEAHHYLGLTRHAAPFLASGQTGGG